MQIINHSAGMNGLKPLSATILGVASNWINPLYSNDAEDLSTVVLGKLPVARDKDRLANHALLDSLSLINCLSFSDL
jgi:hypothetical protein